MGGAVLHSGRAGVSKVELELLLKHEKEQHRLKFDELLSHYGMSSGDPGVQLVGKITSEHRDSQCC